MPSIAFRIMNYNLPRIAPDGYSDPAERTASQAEVVAICPTPWKADDWNVRDATGRAVLSTYLCDLPGTPEQRGALARANARRVVTALNAEESRHHAILAARLHAQQELMLQLAELLTKTYQGPPLTEDGCRLCGAPWEGRTVHHTDACLFDACDDALAEAADDGISPWGTR